MQSYEAQTANAPIETGTFAWYLIWEGGDGVPAWQFIRRRNPKTPVACCIFVHFRQPRSHPRHKQPERRMGVGTHGMSIERAPQDVQAASFAHQWSRSISLICLGKCT